MNPEIFEAIMLVCFGLAWPFSIYRMLKTKTSQGKSMFFLVVILIGYISGILFEITGSRDKVIYLYLLNMFLVTADIALSIKYRAPAPRAA